MLAAAQALLREVRRRGGRPVDDPRRLLQLAARARAACAGWSRTTSRPACSAPTRTAAGGLIIEELTSRKSAVRHPRDARPARRRAPVAGEAHALEGGPLRAAADRRAAGDEHDLGRRRRAAARADGRRRPAQEHRRVHPGDQPRRPASSRAWSARSSTGRGPRDLSHYETFEHYHAHLLPARRGAVGHAVRAARARPRPDRRARLAAPAVGPEWNANPGAGAVDRRPARAAWRRARRSRARGRRPDRRGRRRRSTRRARRRGSTQWSARGGRSASATSATERRGRSDADVGLLQEPGPRRLGRLDLPDLAARRRARPSPLVAAPDAASTPAAEPGTRPSAAADADAEDGRMSSRAEPRRRAAPEPAAAHLRGRLDRRPAELSMHRAWASTTGRTTLRRADLRGAPARRRAAPARARRSQHCCPDRRRMTSNPFDERASVGVPVAPFPRWLRCPLCSLLAPIEPGLFELQGRPLAPGPHPLRPRELPESTGTAADGVPGPLPDGLRGRPPRRLPVGRVRPPAASPLRRHAAAARARRRRARRRRPGLAATSARRRRRLSQAFGEDGRPFLPPRCRGRHPHLRHFDATAATRSR